MANMHIPGIHFDQQQRSRNDANGNMIELPKPNDEANSFDATYDAWNRLLTVTKACREDSDSAGEVALAALTEGSVIKQYVWAAPGIGASGGGYIDELVQIAINGNTIVDEEFDPDNIDHKPNKYYALQDTNFNVLGIVAGDLVERYEYTPYGKRQVYTSAGSNDPLCNAPTNGGQRVHLILAARRRPTPCATSGIRGYSMMKRPG